MEPIFHYFLPIFVLLFFFPKLKNKLGIKKILLLGFLALIPDLDCFFGAHRLYFHNIFLVIIISLFFYFVFGRLIGLLSLYFTSSHLLLDLSKPGIAILYPFTNKLVYLDIMISNAYKWFLKIDYGILKAGVIDPLYPHNYLHQFGALFLILIGIMFIVKILKERKSIL